MTVLEEFLSAMASAMSQATMEIGSRKSRRLSLDTWASVLARSNDLISEGPCTPEKAFSHATSVTASFGGAVGDSAQRAGCETPKSTQFKIPAVDVDICPPAPKKLRGMRRLVFSCATECENADRLGLSPGYFF